MQYAMVWWRRPGPKEELVQVAVLSSNDLMLEAIGSVECSDSYYRGIEFAEHAVVYPRPGLPEELVQGAVLGSHVLMVETVIIGVICGYSHDLGGS